MESQVDRHFAKCRGHNIEKMNNNQVHNSKLLLITLSILFFVQNQCWRFKIFNFALFERVAPFDEIVAGACVLLWGFAMVLQLQNSDFRQRNYRSVVIGFFVAISISYLFGSVITYHQDPLRIWRVFFWFSGLLMYFYLMRIGGYADQALRIFKFLAIYGLAVASFSALVAYIRPLAELLDESAVTTRFGMVRVILFDDGVALIYFYFLSRLLVAKQAGIGLSKNLLNWVGIAFALFCLISLGLSRQRIASVMAVTITASIFSLYLPGFRKQTGFWLIIMVLVLVIVGSGLSDFMNVFSSSLDTSRGAIRNEANMSVYVREKGMKYYFDQFVQTKFMGIGWVSSVTSTQNNAILKANIAGMKLVDLGVFEVLFRYGLLGLLVYLRFMWVALKQVKFINRHGDPTTRVVALTLGMFLIAKIMSLNTIFFFPGHCIFYAVIMYILDTLFQSLRQMGTAQVVADIGAIPSTAHASYEVVV